MRVEGAVAAVALVSAVLAGCDSAQSEPGSSAAGRPTATTPAPTAAAPPGGCRPVETQRVAADAVLVPGPGNGLGPSPARGDALVIAGAVLDASCEPVAGAEIDVWHTDARGAYGPAEGQCCYYQGTVGTDRNGRFRLDTVRPGQYAQTAAPPAHIHLEVRHPAGELRTEIVFVGDAGVPTAPVDGYAPVRLQRRGAGPPAWYGEVTLVVGGRTAGA